MEDVCPGSWVAKGQPQEARPRTPPIVPIFHNRRRANPVPSNVSAVCRIDVNRLWPDDNQCASCGSEHCGTTCDDHDAVYDFDHDGHH